jgi:uncharacterized membrane protein
MRFTVDGIFDGIFLFLSLLIVSVALILQYSVGQKQAIQVADAMYDSTALTIGKN